MAIQTVQVQRKLFTVEGYEQMIRAGVLHEDERQELIEVADTTIDYDRSVKIPLYGRNEIVECWLIDLAAHVVEVYRGPAASGYRIKQTYGPGDHIGLAALPTLSVGAEEILR